MRARRLQWLGHILRMGTGRNIKQMVFEMTNDKVQEGRQSADGRVKAHVVEVTLHDGSGQREMGNKGKDTKTIEGDC